MTIRLLLADDHQIVREGLRSVLESHADLMVVAEAGDGRQTMRLAEKTRPEVVIMDLNMPDLNGIEATRQIKSQNPAIKIIGLSVHTESQLVSEMFKAGCSGYLPKRCAAKELVNAIHTVVADKMYLSPEITAGFIDSQLRHPPRFRSTAFDRLSEKERQVLQLLAEGNAVKEIASQLSLSVPTVHTHRQNIMKKLNLHSVAELTKYAIREGLTSL